MPLRAAGLRVDQREDTELRRSQAERLDRLGEGRRDSLARVGEQEARGACEWLGRGPVESHAPQMVRPTNVPGANPSGRYANIRSCAGETWKTGASTQGRLAGLGDSVVRTFDAPEALGIRFHEVQARSALNRVPERSRMPFRWTINPYRGCTHACVYCFARPTHKYLDLNCREDFEREIVVKVNAPEVVRAELARRSWTGEHVALGTNTDPYQWVEGRYRLTRGIWEAMRDFSNPCSVLTKSPLLLRDLDLMKELVARTDFVANLSIPTLDEKAWRASEPHTPHPRKRIEAVAELAREGIPTGVLIAPLMPGINDSPAAGRGAARAGRRGGGQVGGQRGPSPARRGPRDRLRLDSPVPARPHPALRGALRGRRVPARRASAAG